MAPVRSTLCVFLSLLLTLAAAASAADHPPLFELHPSSRQISREYTRAGLIAAINAQSLPLSERLAIVRATSKVLSEFNPNTFLHINFLHQDAKRRLYRVGKQAKALSNFQFHLALIRIFADLDDLHTVYIPPEPLRSAAAVTLTEVATYYTFAGAKRPKYYFPGSQIRLLAVNGRDVHKVARELGQAAYAANAAAKIEYGRQALTLRSLSRDYWPGRENESYTFVVNNDTTNQITRSFPWSYYALTPEAARRVNDGESLTDTSSSGAANAQVSSVEVHVAPDEVQQRHIKPLKRTPPPPHRSTERFPTDIASADVRTPVEIDPSVSEYLIAQIVHTSSGPVGHIRLTTFFPPFFSQVDIIVQEIGRLLSSVMPHNAVVFDIRDNPGGYLRLAKFVFELLHVNKNVPPLPVFSRATRTTVSMYTETGLSPEAQFEADILSAAVREAFSYGEQFTGPTTALYSLAGAFEGIVDLPRTPAKYNGSFVLLTSSRSFSASDMMSAWTRDAGKGIVVGVAASTGGGGATVLRYERQIRGNHPKTFGQALSKGVDFTTAAIRFFRSGMKSGTLVELFGVTPEVRYYPTLRDSEEDDADMFGFLANLLKRRSSAMP